MVMRQSDVSTEIVTVYQQVYVCGATTKVHVTMTDTDGEVIARHFSTYEPYPLAKIAAQHQAFLLRAIRRSFDVESVIFDCNVMGRMEYTPEGNGWNSKVISHPRFGDSEKVRVIWHEPTTDEEEEGEETSE